MDWKELEAPHEKAQAVAPGLGRGKQRESAKIRLWEAEKPVLPSEWSLSRPGPFTHVLVFERGTYSRNKGQKKE